MADIRVLYTEEMIGYGHPSKQDTLNRGLMVSHDASGHHSSVDFPSFYLDSNGTGQSITTTGATTINLSTAGIRFNEGFTISSTGFSCPSTGKYLVGASIRPKNGLAGIYETILLFRNSSKIAEGNLINAHATNYYQNSINAIVACESTTDIFSFKYYLSGGTAALASDANCQYFYSYKVGP